MPSWRSVMSSNECYLFSTGFSCYCHQQHQHRKANSYLPWLAFTLLLKWTLWRRIPEIWASTLSSPRVGIHDRRCWHTKNIIVYSVCRVKQSGSCKKLNKKTRSVVKTPGLHLMSLATAKYKTTKQQQRRHWWPQEQDDQNRENASAE